MSRRIRTVGVARSVFDPVDDALCARRRAEREPRAGAGLAERRTRTAVLRRSVERSVLGQESRYRKSAVSSAGEGIHDPLTSGRRIDRENSSAALGTEPRAMPAVLRRTIEQLAALCQTRDRMRAVGFAGEAVDDGFAMRSDVDAIDGTASSAARSASAGARRAVERLALADQIRLRLRAVGATGKTIHNALAAVDRHAEH